MEINVDALIDDFRKFEELSYSKYKDLFEQIRKDRKFIAGEQADALDHTLTDATVGDVVPPIGLNVVQNAIRTVVNTYLPNPYKWQYENQPDLTKKADLFLGDVDNYTATVEALTSAVGTALGVLVFSTDYEVDGSVKPVLYSLPDVTNVRLDPYASKLNFADATKAAIVELKSKKWIEQNYGLSYSSDYTTKPLIDISEDYDRKNYLPLVTFYVKEEKSVVCYKLLGNDLLEEPVVLPYSYIPVVPVFGESTWSTENKMSWSGITTLMRPIQRIINYSYRQLVIRAATVPKNTWVGSDEAVENREAYWKNANKTLNPIRIYNSVSKDGKRVLEPPQRVTDEIQFGDVSQLLQNALGLTNSIVGIPATGLETDVTKTATEVLTNQKTFNNNVRNYIYHLKYSIQLIGMLFAEEIAQRQLYGQVKVSVVAGPDDAMSKQEARVTLQSYLPLVTTDEQRQKLLAAECAIENDNEYITNFAQSLTPAPTAGELQAQQMLQQADTEIKTRDQQIMQLQKELNDLRLQQQLQAYSTEQQLLLNNQKFEHEREMKLLDAQIAAGNPAEQARTEVEIMKAKTAVEKEAISLRKEQIKAMNREVI